jgi:hypothetical protein
MQSRIKMAASKQVTKQEVNGVQSLETRPRDHTFTSGHTPNKYNITSWLSRAFARLDLLSVIIFDTINHDFILCNQI